MTRRAAAQTRAIWNGDRRAMIGTSRGPKKFPTDLPNDPPAAITGRACHESAFNVTAANTGHSRAIRSS